MRIGVGEVPPGWELVDWVLSVFRNQDAETILETAARAADAVECVITRGVQEAMNRYNG